MTPHRDILDFTAAWRFRRGAELPLEVLTFGNTSLIANETRIWQKAGNHGIARTDNPHVDEWRSVDLPHDFVIEGEFTPEASLNNGSLKGDVAWYVKKFALPESDSGRRIAIEFDGVYRNCSVFCNGHSVGGRMSGYASFAIDLTEVCDFGGKNAIAVRVDARENELWSYEGGGIYRAVRLVKTAPLHVAPWGIRIRTGEAANPGQAEAAVTLRNRTYAEAEVCILCRILDSGGGVAAENTTTAVVPAMNEAEAVMTLEVDAPKLWSLENPTLYTLVTEVLVDGNTVDRYDQTFGFRYFHFDGATGFHLNGQPLKLKGVCCHQDSAGVGVAVPPALQEWRVRTLKEMGCNAIRTSHNPPDPALLDACDRLGMLVMDELRIPGIADELLADLADLIRRDRNHPSVILWSLGNEEFHLQATATGAAIFKRLNHLAHSLDPTRPTTYGCNALWVENCDFHLENGLRFDVFGANYRSRRRSESYDEFHAKHPDWPLIGSETWGGGCTRGLYRDDGCPLSDTAISRDGWADEDRFVSAYANWTTPWGYSIEQTWQDCADRPFLAGTFIWTGFDYRGETSPYDWPAVITRFGLLDLCGFYKPVAHYLRAWWRPDDPHIFLMPHWNWEGSEGKPIRVRCCANTASVELLLNGESLGRKNMPVNSLLEWEVPYEPGDLVAIGFDAEGSEVARTVNRTAGPPASVRVETEQVDDIVVVNAAIVDENGTVCPEADDEVLFEADGPARLLGVGNGNPISHEPDQGTNRRKAYHGLCQAIYRVEEGARVHFRAELARITTDSGKP